MRCGGILLVNGHGLNRNGLKVRYVFGQPIVFQTCFPQVAIAAAVRKVQHMIGSQSSDREDAEVEQLATWEMLR